MRARVHVFRCTIALLICLSGAASPVSAQSTAFTYQGSLDDAGTRASGPHDFRFRLFSVASGGTPIGSTLCVDNVSVVEGVFTVQLDFGQQYATTGQRFLEVEVRRDTGLNCSNLGGFVIMAPRQQLTATPMASHANSAFSLDAADGSPTSAVFVDGEGRVGIGRTTPEWPLDVNGDFRWGGEASNYAWSGNDGGGLFIEQAGNTSATSGIRLQISKSSDFTNYSQFLMNANTGFSFMNLGTGSSNVGIGTTAPAAKLDVRGDIRFGSTGQLHAMGSEDMIRIVRGTVASNGVVNDGPGFTSTRLSLGEYRVTFDTPFSDKATITVTPLNLDGATAGTSDNFGTSVRVVITQGGTRIDNFFDFIAIGPQ